MLDIVNPDLARVDVHCAPWGVPAVLVLILPREARSLLGALWLPPWGGIYEAVIGRA